MNKKLFLSFTLILYSAFTFAQTAVDFTTNDCLGNPHHLFGELDAGKVVVISFVDPCGACINPTISAFVAAQQFATSFPGRINTYVADDLGNTDCSTLDAWNISSGIGHVTTFSDTLVSQGDYGPGGMPKIVVLGGNNHHVYYSENTTLDSTAYYTAVVQALAATGIDEVNSSGFKLEVFPNPASETYFIDFYLKEKTTVTIEIYSVLGEKISWETIDNTVSGKNTIEKGTAGLKSGLYFIKLKTADFSEERKLMIER